MPSSPPGPCRAMKTASGASDAQPRDQVLAEVEGGDLVAERGERVLDPGAGAHRDLALQRAAALEHRDLHDSSFRRGIGTTSPPGSGSGGRLRRCSPVIVSYSAICSETTWPIRRTPSRISHSVEPEKLSRIEAPPRPST